MNYYNDNDRFCVEWLHNLIREGLIPEGDVDERDIREVSSSDLKGYEQVHFFAGIGGWSLALQLAGWSGSVWTGSCPCQPFSTAGKRAGTTDERHLWPEFFRLISECRPAVVFGEQVASKDGLAWLDIVSADMEVSGYAFGAADLCAAGIGAPHIRQRLFFVAKRVGDSFREGLERHGWNGNNRDQSGWIGQEQSGSASPTGSVGRMADSNGNGCGKGRKDIAATGRDGPFRDGSARRMANGTSGGWGEERQVGRGLAAGDRAEGLATGFGTGCGDLRPGPTNGFWRDADWLHCRDGKWRPVEPGTFPLAHGIPARVGKLRAYGNAIVPQVAEEFIKAVMKPPTAKRSP